MAYSDFKTVSQVKTSFDLSISLVNLCDRPIIGKFYLN